MIYMYFPARQLSCSSGNPHRRASQQDIKSSRIPVTVKNTRDKPAPTVGLDTAGDTLQIEGGTALSGSTLETVMANTGRGFTELQQQILSACKYKNQLSNEHKVEINIKWEIHKVAAKNSFAQVVSISGNEVDAQAVQCGAYIQEHFPAAKDLLPALQATYDSGISYEGNISECLRHLAIKLHDPEKTGAAVIAVGSLKTLIELTQAFAWLCCTIMPASSEGIKLSTFDFDVEARGNQPQADLAINLFLSQEMASGLESSWHMLFTGIGIVLDSPISNRSQFGKDGMCTEKSASLVPSTALLSVSSHTDYSTQIPPFRKVLKYHST